MLRAMSRLALVLGVLLLSHGCSFLFVNGPPDGHEQMRYFDCVSNGAGPAGDASWAIFDGLLAAAAASVDGDVNDEGEEVNTGAGVALFGVAAAVHAGSMIYGLVQINDCSDAKQHLQERITDHDSEHRRRIEELERQLTAQQAPAATPAPSPHTLELVPAAPAEPQPAPPAAQPQVPPPPDAYTQPP
jgi:hypothetical protein